MRLSFFNIADKETFAYKGDADIYNKLNNTKNIVSFNSVNGKIIVERVEGICVIRFKVVAKLTVLSSVSNNPFPYKEEIDEVLYYTNRKDKINDDYILIGNNDYLEIEEVIYSFIVANLPITLHKKNEVYPSGENFRVMTEDEFYASESEDGLGNNAFDKLKDLDLDEDK